MSFIVILIALGLQWFLKIYSASYQFNWEEPYFEWMQKRFSALTSGHGLFGVLLLVVPIILAISIFFTIFYHIFGTVGYFILSLALLWYCMDARDLKQSPYSDAGKSNLFLLSYQRVFALLFWYFVFGPMGLALYVVVSTLRKLVVETSVAAKPDLIKYFKLTQGVLDWVPMRLLGLSFALAGNFGSVFKSWMKVLFQGISDSQDQVIVWGKAAISGENKTSKQDQTAVISLINRTLLIWLVAMALISLGVWIG